MSVGVPKIPPIALLLGPKAAPEGRVRISHLIFDMAFAQVTPRHPLWRSQTQTQEPELEAHVLTGIRAS